jgi:pyruvate/2-oxoglutarate dehydrogenase complex dihydrolipoamide acyltransferase (E2) component
MAAAVTVLLSVPTGALLAQTAPTGTTAEPAQTTAPAAAPATAPAPAASPAPAAAPAATPPASTTTAADQPSGVKKKKAARMTRQQEIDKSIDSGTVPSRYRKQVPKEYQQYIPFSK